MTPLERKLKIIAIILNVLFILTIVIGGAYLAGFATGRAYERRNINFILETYYLQTEEKQMIVKGKLIKAKRETKTFNGNSGKEKLYISVKDVKIDPADMDTIKAAYKEVGTKFTPEWVKNFEGYVNVSTTFDIDTMKPDGTTGKLTEIIKEGYPFYNAVVLLTLNVKDGAVYPGAIKILEDGEPYNPFGAFDNYKED